MPVISKPMIQPAKVKTSGYQPRCLEESHLQTQDGHEVYFSRWGNPEGQAVLFVHGGPGGGTDPSCSRFFDPVFYHVILVDQRGCGQSRPLAKLEANTTDHLIEDFEAIRCQLGIDQWILFGGSWGSTLSLIYAKRHPERISRLILRGLFLGRQQDYEWLYSHGASLFFPEAWQRFCEGRDVSRLIDSYGDDFIHKDMDIRLKAAKAWCLWEAEVSCLSSNESVVEAMSQSNNTLALASIEQHYFAHQCFIPENYLLTRDESLVAIPIDLVHGRYDLCCQLSNATCWQALYPHTHLHVIERAGHSMTEPGIEDCLISICDRIKKEAQ